MSEPAELVGVAPPKDKNTGRWVAIWRMPAGGVMNREVMVGEGAERQYLKGKNVTLEEARALALANPPTWEVPSTFKARVAESKDRSV